MTSPRALPSYPNPFVGRARELERLEAAIRGGARLVTIQGPAGVGKSRLAVEYAARAADRVPVRFCDLTASQLAEDVSSAVAHALEVPADRGANRGELAARVGAWLREYGPAVVVLDNFEQVVEWAAVTAGAWHRVAPQVVLLVTSRAPLALADEVVVSLEPFAPPVNDAAEELEDNEAVRLFLSAAGPRADGSAARARIELVAEVVRSLEGLPLAIELAAARLEVLGLEEVRARLARRFELLRDLSGARSSRHDTLWHAIDWSWQLLRPWERDALAQASVFAGGFGLAAAEAVVALPSGPEGPSVLDALQSLHRKSLVRVARAQGQEARFSLYASIREYAAAQLAQERGTTAAEARHAGYYLAQGAAHAAVDSRGGAEHFRWLAAERDNLVAVFDRAIAVRPPTASSASTALEAADALGPLLDARSSVAAQLTVFDAALGAADGAGAEVPPLLVARVLGKRGYMHRYRGDLAASEADASRALALARAVGARDLEGVLLGNLGNLRALAHRGGEARAHYEAALALHRATGDRRNQGVMLAALGVQDLDEGDFASAARRYTEALALLQEAGDRRFEGIVRGYLGALCMEQGDLDAALGHLGGALALHREVGNARFEATALGLLGHAWHLQSDLDAARDAYEQTVVTMRRVGDRRFEGIYLGYVALVDLERGAADVARAGLDAALDVLREVDDRRQQGVVLATMACEQALRGEVDAARGTGAAAAERLAGLDDPLIARLPEVPEALCALAEAAGLPAREELARREALHRRADELAPTRSDDVRLLLRVLRRALAEADARAAAWTIEAAGAWFQPPGGARVSLESRPTLGRVLACLAHARLEAPGTAVAHNAIIAAGWPGSKILPRAAANRLHVAVSTLRKLGLGPVLVRAAGGYLFDAATPLRIERGASAPVDEDAR